MRSKLQAGVLETKLFFEGHDVQEMTEALVANVPPDDSVSLLALRPDTPEQGRARTRDDSERARIPTVKK